MNIDKKISHCKKITKNKKEIIMKKVNNISILIIGVFLLIYPPLFGQGQLSIEDHFVKKADLIVSGKVKDMVCKWAENKKDIYTYITVNCIDWHKGPKLKSITIKTYGGIIGDVGMDISTAAKYKISEKIFVFLKKNTDGTYSVVEAGEGKFTYKGNNIINEYTGKIYNHELLDNVNKIVTKQKTNSK